jgi:hypothetical protein
MSKKANTPNPIEEILYTVLGVVTLLAMLVAMFI